jgi:hypothetical protein
MPPSPSLLAEQPGPEEEERFCRADSRDSPYKDAASIATPISLSSVIALQIVGSI